MPTRKIEDANYWAFACNHPDHEPPSMKVFEPGTYMHECSGCGRKSMFRINKPRMETLTNIVPRSTGVGIKGSFWEGQPCIYRDDEDCPDIDCSHNVPPVFKPWYKRYEGDR